MKYQLLIILKLFCITNLVSCINHQPVPKEDHPNQLIIKPDTQVDAHSESQTKIYNAQHKAESKHIVSAAKKYFENKIHRAWDVPIGVNGTKATATVILTDSGSVASVIVHSSNPNLKTSVEAAIRSAAPYPMPDDPDARREVRRFVSTFIAK